MFSCYVELEAAGYLRSCEMLRLVRGKIFFPIDQLNETEDDRLSRILQCCGSILVDVVKSVRGAELDRLLLMCCPLQMYMR